MARSLASVLYIVHCTGFILPKQFREWCQVKYKENDPYLVGLFRTAGHYTQEGGQCPKHQQNLPAGLFLNDAYLPRYIGHKCVFICLRNYM